MIKAVSKEMSVKRPRRSAAARVSYAKLDDINEQKTPQAEAGIAAPRTATDGRSNCQILEVARVEKVMAIMFDENERPRYLVDWKQS